MTEIIKIRNELLKHNALNRFINNSIKHSVSRNLDTYARKASVYGHFSWNAYGESTSFWIAFINGLSLKSKSYNFSLTELLSVKLYKSKDIQ